MYTCYWYCLHLVDVLRLANDCLGNVQFSFWRITILQNSPANNCFNCVKDSYLIIFIT